jgi:hypothetical protein
LSLCSIAATRITSGRSVKLQTCTSRCLRAKPSCQRFFSFGWDAQLERDFSPGGKHEKMLEKLDAEIDAGNFTPLS